MPRPKKLKRSRPDDYEDDGDVSDQRVKSSAKSSKKAKTAGAADSGKDDEGNSFWAVCHPSSSRLLFDTLTCLFKAGWHSQSYRQ